MEGSRADGTGYFGRKEKSENQLEERTGDFVCVKEIRYYEAGIGF